MSLRKIFTCVFLLISTIPVEAQRETYSQFWSYISFARVIHGKWSAEGILSGTRSSKANESGMFNLQSNFGIELWGQYHANAKMQFAGQLAYFSNKNVPDLNQSKSTEIRITPQVVYFFNKQHYIFSTRARMELRILKNEEGAADEVYRYRQQLNLIYPFNSKVIREGVYYGIVAEELFFKTNSDVSGFSFFDRNNFRIGLGYAVSDNFQLQASYINEFLPRSSGDKIYNAFKISLLFNNFLSEVRGYLSDLRKNSDEGVDE
jgi:hypothetical protein